MSYHDAVNILDLRRAGADMPESVVMAALEATGDIDRSQYAKTVSKAMRDLILEAE